MARYQFARPVRGPELLRELLAAGLPSEGLLVEFDGGPDFAAHPGTTCWVTCADADLARVQAVVAAHDVTAYDLQAQQAATKLAQARQVLRDYYLNSAPTNAQSVTAIKALIVAVRALAQIDT